MFRKYFLLFYLFITIFCAKNICAQYTDYAQQTFNTLLKSIAQTTPSKPTLYISDDINLIAKTLPNGDIFIGNTLINHCRSFGKDSCNAIAHVLSHELMHYYNNHFWGNNFGTSYADMAWGQEIQKTIKDTSIIEVYETQADEYGMYYAFNAGYTTYNIGGRVLDSIYHWYGLNDHLPGYPSLQDRKLITTEAKKHIQLLIPFFETGNMVMQLAQLQNGETQSSLLNVAGSCFETIINNTIKTKELYNNTAVGKIMLANNYIHTLSASLHFPYMLETKSILYNTIDNRGNTDINKSYAYELLDEAIAYLNLAIKLDKAFYPAYINLSIADIMIEDYGAAQDALNHAKKSIDTSTTAAWVLPEIEAMLAFTHHDFSAMETSFSEATKLGSLSASMNYAALQNEINTQTNTYNYTPQSDIFDNTIFEPDTLELYNTVWIGNYLNELEIHKQNRFNTFNKHAILYIDTTKNYIYYDIKPHDENISFTTMRIMVTTHTSTEKTSRGIKLHDKTSDVEKLYGKPQNILTESDAIIYNYPNQNLLIWLKNGVVTKWSYWWIK